jgi:methionyl-tRNA synthetase
MSSFYVTTAIPYVNGEPHLGFALELVQADVLARYHRLCGDRTWFLTGTDENSLTNVLVAEREGLPVGTLVDRNAEVFRGLTRALHISNDDFIRTAADPRHREGVERFWRACVASGDVYTQRYRGLYCVRCEQFFAADELVQGRCPDHDLVPEVVEEVNYFFRLSRYAEPLRALLASRALRVVPESRHREVEAFVARGLTDFSISRSRSRARGWGIPVPGDAEQVVYVWFDALTNYITALGYGAGAAAYGRVWVDNPQRVHVIGKNILRFHAVYWPAMLLSAGAPLPTRIVVHGFLTHAGRKMSKTLGTGVAPAPLAEAWGADALRYWLLREVPPSGDADYTEASFARAYEADLAGQLGNLLQRTVSMLHRYRGGVVPAISAETMAPLRAAAGQLPADLDRALGKDWDPRAALESIFRLVRRANQSVEEAKPWAPAQAERGGNAAARRHLDGFLGDLAECLRLVAEALRPLLPQTAERMATQLGTALAPVWGSTLEWGRGRTGARVGPPVALFPKQGMPSG